MGSPDPDSLFLSKVGGSSSGGGSGSGGSGTTPSAASMDGTWQLAYATDYSGQAYDLSQATMESIRLVVSGSKATFYYFDDDPFSGTLERYSEQDDYYASDGYTVKAYKLKGNDGFWEFAFVVPQDGNDAFWYLEVGSPDPDSLFLSKVGGSSSGGSSSGGKSGGSSTASTKVGTWTLSYAIDMKGNPYDLSQDVMNSVKLIVRSDESATFYYMDEEPFHGTMVRYSDNDYIYATTDYRAECYHLVAGDGSYWEFAFITPKDGTNDPFWYLEVGPEDDYDMLFLHK